MSLLPRSLIRARKPHREAWHETARGYELSIGRPTDADDAAIIAGDQVTTNTMAPVISIMMA